MNKEELFEALSEIDPASVEGAGQYKKKATPIWLKWGAMAASAAIIVGVMLGVPAMQNGTPQGPDMAAPTAVTTTTTLAAFDGDSDEPVVSDVSDVTENSDVSDVTEPSDPTITQGQRSVTTKKTADAATTTKKTTATTTKRTWLPTLPTTLPTAIPTTQSTGKPTTTTKQPATTATTRPEPMLPASSEEPSEEPACSDIASQPPQEEPCEEPNVVISEKNGIQSISPVYPKLGDFLERWQKSQAAAALQSGMSRYYTNVMKKLLTAKDANTVCSPLSTYLSFAMMAEVTGGNTRQQLLNMLGVSSIDTLRSNASLLWEANYNTAEDSTCLLANSMWLKNGVVYNEDTLARLATKYYASSFIGTPGTSAMDQALRDWTNENTGGLLKQYTSDMSLSSDTVLALVSTIYFKSNWMESFREANTKRETFHGTKGDTTVDMMHMTEVMDVYRTDRFMSVGLSTHGGTMYFVLPNKNVDVNSLLTDANVFKALSKDSSDSHWSEVDLILSVPKFNVSAKSDLMGMLKSLGVTDVMNGRTANFTPLAADREMFLAKAEHAATVEINEKGVTAAAYTMDIVAEPCAYETLVFTIDRPFMFVVTGSGGSILFAGIVRNP